MAFASFIFEVLSASGLSFGGGADSPPSGGDDRRGSDLGWVAGTAAAPALEKPLYVLALSEGYLPEILRSLVIGPVDTLARHCHRFLSGPGWRLCAGALLAITVSKIAGWENHESLQKALVAVLIAVFALTAFSERKSPLRVWDAVGISSVLAGFFPSSPSRPELATFGFTSSEYCPPGSWEGDVWARTCGEEPGKALRSNGFWGMVSVEPAVCRWLFVAVLGLAAFPITPTFLGEDLLFRHCTGQFVWMAAPIAFAFVMNGFTLVRLYAKIGLGPRR